MKRKISFKEIKEAFVQTCKEKPETAAKIAWVGGVTIFMIGSYIYMRDLDKRLVQVAKFADISAINDEQHFCNALGRIDYICDQLKLDKAAMELAGQEMAKANWARLGGTEKAADAMVAILNAGATGTGKILY